LLPNKPVPEKERGDGKEKRKDKPPGKKRISSDEFF
jgi:hypothetical protein